MEPLVNLVRSGDALFDVSVLTEEIAQYPNVFRDPQDLYQEITFWICHDVSYRQLAESEFESGIRRGLYAMGFITLRPTFITVGLETIRETLAQMASIVVPIITKFDCQIVNEYGLDLTQRYQSQPEFLFDPDWIPPEVEVEIDSYWKQQGQLWQQRRAQSDAE